MIKKAMMVSAALIFAFVGTAVADEVVPGAATWTDSSVMGVGKTMMEIGAKDRAMTQALNLNSRSMMASGGFGSGGVNANYQFGSSQTDQSWKKARTVEEAQVRGLVPGDCQGDNSDDAYRRQMNQNRDGYMKENLVSNARCEVDHPTIK